MTTPMLAQRSRPLDEARLEAVVDAAGLSVAWNTLDEGDPHRLEVVFNGLRGPALEVSADYSVACGSAITTALLEHRGTECDRWAVRVLAWDEPIAAWTLLREWRSNG